MLNQDLPKCVSALQPSSAFDQTRVDVDRDDPAVEPDQTRQ
jgi:hypothetical protein